MSSLIDGYLAGFLARCAAVRQPGQTRIDRPGVHGLVPSDHGLPTSLVIDDDAALELVPDVATRASNGTVAVFDAPRCSDLLDRDPRWLRRTATAMLAPDLGTLHLVELPADLVIRPVARLATERPGVRVEEAAAQRRVSGVTSG